jgi:hypothetical protein
MDRRAFLGRAGLAVAVASTGALGLAPRAEAAGTPGMTSRAEAAGTPGLAPRAEAAPRAHVVSPVVSWELSGGFMGPGFASLRPATLVIYPDGRAIADASRLLRLSDPELAKLVRKSVAVLRNPANGRRRPGAPVIADVPDTRFQARDGLHRYAIQAQGLPETRASHAYPQPLYGLLDRLTPVRDKALSSGTAYRGDGVRLVVVSATGTTGASPWPTGVPVPATSPDRVDAVRDLTGKPAHIVARVIPHRNTWDWQIYRTPDGRVLRAAWRYLLPHELPH